MTALLWIPLLVPLLTALAVWWRRSDGWTRGADLAVAVVVLGTGLGLLATVHAEGPVVAGGGDVGGRLHGFYFFREFDRPEGV